MRTYKCLQINEFQTGNFKLVPIRDEDKYAIMRWRNEQIDILRQKQPLTKEQQENYFATVVSGLFMQEKPQQLLFSFLENDILIGYGGLVHIDWINQNAELSFLVATELEAVRFEEYWCRYLDLIEKIVFEQLNFHKVYTYAFDLRPKLYLVLEQNNFFKEAVLREHCRFDDIFINVVIHSKINSK